MQNDPLPEAVDATAAPAVENRQRTTAQARALMARPAVYSDDRVGTTCRLPRDLLDRLTAEANKRAISRNLIIERAIEDWLTAAGVPSVNPQEGVTTEQIVRRYIIVAPTYNMAHDWRVANGINPRLVKIVTSDRDSYRVRGIKLDDPEKIKVVEIGGRMSIDLEEQLREQGWAGARD